MARIGTVRALVFALGLCALLVTPVPAGAAPRDSCATPSRTLHAEVPWPQKRLAPQRVWPLTSGEGVLVAIVDTGVDASVPQLAGKVRHGYDVVNGGGAADTDCHGHGTFVAGIIAAQPAEGTGMAGLAPGVTILPVRQANGDTDGTASSLARAIVTAADADASVINVSATTFTPTNELKAAVEYATSRDVVIVAAAANSAQQGNPPAYPAAYPEVIAVGAIGPGGERGSYSEVGSYLDLVAPGTDVVSLSRSGAGHVIKSGTSFAAPFVAATAALVRAYHPRLNAAQVKRRMEITADHPGRQVPDPAVGWGVVNPYAAVTAVLAEESGTVTGNPAQQPLPPIAEPPPDTGARAVALRFALVGGALAAGLALLIALVPRAHRRRWQGAA